MGRIAEAQLPQRPLHVAWNRAAPADLLVLMEDGSAHRLDVGRCLEQRAAGQAPFPLSAQVLRNRGDYDSYRSTSFPDIFSCMQHNRPEATDCIPFQQRVCICLRDHEHACIMAWYLRAAGALQPWA